MNLYPTIARRFSTAAKLFLLTVILTATIQAQSSGVDLSFNTVVSKDGNGGFFTLQPDGKILVFGGFLGGIQVVNGVIKNHIVRLNPDGSLDNSFDCPACDFEIRSVTVQPDGKIIVAGAYYSTVTLTYIVRMARLNSDGSLDASFTSPFGTNFPQFNVAVSAIQPDGKILVSGFHSGGSSGTSQWSLYRLNPNGSIDNTFMTIDFQSGGSSYETINKVLVQPDGKILISGGYTGNTAKFLRRYNADGTSDTTFESPVLTGNPDVVNNYSVINDFDVQPDGKIVFGGLFNAVNSVSRINIVRLMPAGNVDLSFVPANVFMRAEPVYQVKVLSSGKILVSTDTGLPTPFPPPAPGNRFIRFNTDGTVDNTFTSPANLTRIVKSEVDASDNVLVYGGFLENGMTVFKFARLNADGSVREYLNAYFGTAGSVTSLAIQPDGKVLLSGDFNRVDNVSRTTLARVNADGTFDSSFNPGVKIDSAITKIVVQPDGKILLAGSFTVNNVSAIGLVRLNSDGSLDVAFNPIIGNNVYSILLQADGKILVGGGFMSVNGQSRIGLARLNSDGTTDTSFNAAFGTSAVIRSIAVQSDGKIMVGGAFNAVGGFARNNLVRLNADGTVDAAFNAGNTSTVNQIEIQPDGKYLALTDTIVRLNSNGTIDTTFQSPTLSGTGKAFLLQPDGTIIIGGGFIAVNAIARTGLARLRPNGTLDSSFFPIGANNLINGIIEQPDGKIIVGGFFTSIANITRLGIARLNVSPYRLITLYDFDGDGKADLSVFRPSNGVWYELRSQNNSFYAFQFGQSGDQIAPADYDGDGKTDIAVFRDTVPGAGNFAYFYITNSSDNSFHPAQFGATGDVPVAGDWDGDGRADLAVYRDGSLTNGQSYFFYRPSSAPGVDFRAIAWGAAGDKPVVGDFDGDGKLDAAVFRPSNGVWYILRSSDNQVMQVQFGLGTDIPVPADYDGTGKTGIAVYRPSNGVWYRSTNAAANYGAVQFGAAGDLPVPADYDGDGKADIAVFRPSNGVWYLLESSNGFMGVQFGANGDKPVPSVFVR